MKKNKFIYELLLIIYGVICASVMWKYSLSCDTEDQMPTRVHLMQQALDNVAVGKIPDVFSYYDSQPTFYLVVPYLSYHIGGFTDAGEVLRLWQNIYALILFCLLPVLCYWLSGKKFMIGIATAPLSWVIWGGVFWKVKTSPYYSFAWGTILSFFILSLLIKETRKGYILGLICAECIVISLSNFVRTESVFGGGILLAGIVFVKEWRRIGEKDIKGWAHLRKSVLNWMLLFSIVLSYISANVFDAGVAAVICKLDNMYVPQNIQSQPWHSLYIGFGFEENPYGIVYQDSCAVAKAQEINPQVVYMSEEYDNIMKKEYFKLVCSEPAWAIGGYLKKMVLCCINSFASMLYIHYAYGNVMNCLLPAAFALAIAVFWIMRKRDDLKLKLKKSESIEYIIMFAFLYFGGMVQGIATVPRTTYLYGSIAMIGIVMLFADLRVLLKCGDILRRTGKRMT